LDIIFKYNTVYYKNSDFKMEIHFYNLCNQTNSAQIEIRIT